MNCNDIRKQIHQFINGEIPDSVFAEHLESCAQCRAYYEKMLQQKELLAMLSPEDAPQFDLLSAKRRKKAHTARNLRWISASAAVFVVVIITGSLMLFGGRGKSADSMAEGAFDAVADAPAADAPAAMAPMEPEADAPAAMAPESEFFAEDSAADEPAADEPAAEEPEDPELCAINLSLPAEDCDALYEELIQRGFHPEPDEFGFYLHPAAPDERAVLAEVLSPYLEQELPPGISEIFISQE